MSPRKSVSGGRLKLRAEVTVSCCSCRSSIWVRYCNCLYKGSPNNLIASNGCNAEALFLVKVIPWVTSTTFAHWSVANTSCIRPWAISTAPAIGSSMKGL